MFRLVTHTCDNYWCLCFCVNNYNCVAGGGPITPAQLLIALHHIEGKGEEMKGVIAATNLVINYFNSTSVYCLKF